MKSKGFSAVYFGPKVFAFNSQQCWGWQVSFNHVSNMISGFEFMFMSLYDIRGGYYMFKKIKHLFTASFTKP